MTFDLLKTLMFYFLVSSTYWAALKVRSEQLVGIDVFREEVAILMMLLPSILCCSVQPLLTVDSL